MHIQHIWIAFITLRKKHGKNGGKKISRCKSIK